MGDKYELKVTADDGAKEALKSMNTAGSFTVKASVDGNDAYEESSQTASVTVRAPSKFENATAEMAWLDLDLATGEAHDRTYTVQMITDPNGLDWTYSYQIDGGTEQSVAGDKITLQSAAEVTVIARHYYDGVLVEKTYTLTVNPSPITVKIENAEEGKLTAYLGEDSYPCGVSYEEVSDLPADVKLSFSITGDLTAIDETGKVDLTSALEGNTATVKATLTPDSENRYTLTNAQAELTVALDKWTGNAVDVTGPNGEDNWYVPDDSGTASEKVVFKAPAGFTIRSSAENYNEGAWNSAITLADVMKNSAAEGEKLGAGSVTEPSGSISIPLERPASRWTIHRRN